jgi:rhodanese-related sulfurtransferase
LAQAEDDPALEAIQEYLEFAEYADGAIMPEQLVSIDSKDIVFVDARNAERFNAGHIPGAMNIEWRQILERRDEIPTDKSVVLYCDTGLSSSRAYFILRLAGRENIKVLRGGYLMWLKHNRDNR